ncbi:XdhC family protein [Costertonia aggregata]|uniref:XdhC family protein n=1 Tax=Costertonia aggregata TaxID=343403 RepID=A0A7H9ATU6_9FLAO|nr:XdhC/CoxI family protein [Costertonia aggregata]QLG46911.1 XdhC family protein [Costertonia aggregata]
MTHEIKSILQVSKKAKASDKKTVLVTVVALEGSSYRRPGVRMLIDEDGQMVGAVSGGCVEKEILRQAQSVFITNVPKMMTYDGRYRLGCEGILSILIEPFNPDDELWSAFDAAMKKRISFTISSYFEKEHVVAADFGSVFEIGAQTILARSTFKPNPKLDIFKQTVAPRLRLVIFGAEHDAVQLCNYASLTGWEVTIVASISEEKDINDFPGAEHFHATEPDLFSITDIDSHTAIILMTHSFVKDLNYLLALKETKPLYLGLLGPTKRREKLLNTFMEHYPLVSDAFIDSIHGPAGLNIGAETPQEIAIAILSEILSVMRKQQPMMLKNKAGRIHNQ